MFANILQPLIDLNEGILRFFHNSLGFSWGMAIIGLTVTIRLAILPLTFKQVRSMQALQQLQPEIKKLQERYKDDKQRMQQEMMDFYKQNQVNPLGSCLPLLLQFPFFMGLFYTLRSSEFKAEVVDSGEKSFLFIKNITEPATGAVLVALIIIYIGTQLGSSHVSAQVAQDKNQKRLLYALPFVFVPFVVQFPAGLLVYWITTNTWTIGQQLTIRKLLPPPHLQEKKAKEADASGGKKGAEATPTRKQGRLAAAAARAGSGGKTSGDGGNGGRGASTARGRSGSGSGSTATEDGGGKSTSRRSSGSNKQQPKASSSGDGGKAKGSSSNGGGNGRSGGGPPPGSPRKKKKRSGRRR